MARRIVEGGYQTTLWARRPESLEPFAETALLIRDDAAAAEDFPRPRVGLALGDAISRAGDWYGSPVNLASRVTGAAPASTVRVTEAARKAIGDQPISSGPPRKRGISKGCAVRFCCMAVADLPLASRTEVIGPAAPRNPKERGGYHRRCIPRTPAQLLGFLVLRKLVITLRST
jgi:hypothetical protein